MSQLLPYEQSIAEKLGQRQIPDMADLIWARIEEQLDTDMPADSGPGKTPPAPPTSGYIKGLGFLVVFAAIIVTFLLVRKPSPHQQEAKPPAVPAAPASAGDTSGAPVVVPHSNQPVRIPGHSPGLNVHLNDTISNALPQLNKPDSTVQPARDTAGKPPPQVLLPVPDTVSIAPLQPPPKKPRGVRMSNPDYRIVPGKDSSK